MAQFSYRISKTRPLPNVNIDKSVFSAEVDAGSTGDR